MTIAEKIEMFKKKKAFIEAINKAFEVRPAGSSVDNVSYEVYYKTLEDGNVYFKEYLVVTFFGGSRSVRVVNGNSNTANFRALGTMLDGGYYDEVFTYEALADEGFAPVEELEDVE